MSMGTDFGRILDQYSDPSVQADQPQVEQDFDHIAQHAEPEMLEQGMSHAFRSDQTPPFGNMVGQMFGQADSGQRAGMLNQLIGALGPAVIGSILGGRAGGAGGLGGLGGLAGGGSGGLGGLGGLLGGLLGGGGNSNAGTQQAPQQVPQLTPQDAERLSPQEVQELATQAEQHNPGIIDQMSRYYAQNPQLFKALGGAALAVALGQIAQRRS
ncbi:MAG: hypothetical protein JWM30_2489 [Burkholderia sp.]|nr:hypothetical protein [Burkholderia sp.]